MMSSDIGMIITNNGRGVQTVDRALLVLTALRDAGEPMRLADLAKRTGVSQPAVHRILVSLRNHGLVDQDPDSRAYQIGAGMLAYADVVRSRPLAEAAAPTCRALRDRHRETVTVQVRVRRDRVVLQEHASPQELGRRVGEGTRLPLHVSASGRAILAFLPPEEVDAYLNGDLGKITTGTTTDRVALQSLLVDVRASGLARSAGEAVSGISAIATPIFSSAGRAIGSIAVSGPTSRWDEVNNEQFANEVLAAGIEVSRRIGLRAAAPWEPGGRR
jgi:DNA-binding IclR family transcriptional regulator